MRVDRLKRMRYRMYVIKLMVRKINLYMGEMERNRFKVTPKENIFMICTFYTIKIFEFTLTKNGHFVLSVYTEMVSVDYLHAYIK